MIGNDYKNYLLQGFDGETLTIGDIESFLSKSRHNSIDNEEINGIEMQKNDSSKNLTNSNQMEYIHQLNKLFIII